MRSHLVDRKRSINLASLASIQMANGVLPLIIFPFALSILGSEQFAKVVLAEALALVVLAIALYSFEIDGVAEVVRLKEASATEQLAETFSSILYLRVALFGVSSIAILFVAYAIDENLVVITLCWLLVPLSYVLQSGWLYQGLENNHPLALITVSTRIAAVAFVFLLVTEPDHYVRVPLVIGLMYVAGGMASLAFLSARLGIKLVTVRTPVLMQRLRDGREVFLSNVSVMLYRDINVLILGTLGVADAGIAAYAMAEKVVKALQASMRPLNQVFFPDAIRSAQPSSKSSSAAFRALMKLSWPQMVLVTVLFAALAISYQIANQRIDWIRRIENVDHIANLVALMSVVAFFGIPNFMLGWTGLNVRNERRYFLRAILITGVVSAIACSALALAFEEVGAAIAFVGAEALLLAFVVGRYCVPSPRDKGDC